MQILFKNKTKYTKQAYNSYLHFHQEKYGYKYKFMTILIIMLLAFCIICNLKYSNFLTSFLILIALIIFVIYRFFYPKVKIQKELKTEKFKKEKEFVFTFYENYFVISNEKLSEKIKYWKLYKVFENSDFFYLYIDKEHAFLLNKRCFLKGDPSKFMQFIKKKIKFKIIKSGI